MTELMKVSGPMFEGAKSGVWESFHRKDGGHYNNYGCRDEYGMRGLREMFPTGEANAMNVVLFSTSGVHGTYVTIEEVEAWVGKPDPLDDSDEYAPRLVTFLIVHPRICTVRSGNCRPDTLDDIAFLKRLRATSWAALATIGRPE